MKLLSWIGLASLLTFRAALPAQSETTHLEISQVEATASAVAKEKSKSEGPGSSTEKALGSGITKLRDRVIYQDVRFYSAFPSIVTRPDGELVVVYYFNQDGGTRHIAGTLLAVGQ